MSDHTLATATTVWNNVPWLPLSTGALCVCGGSYCVVDCCQTDAPVTDIRQTLHNFMYMYIYVYVYIYIHTSIIIIYTLPIPLQ